MCNQVRGVPRRVDDGPSNLFEDGSKWSSSLYTCASTVKATIKTVTFTHNGTSENLDNLRIKAVKEQEYADETDMPLWGLETWDYQLAGIDPIWGLVDEVYEGYPNVSTIRAPSFYLPGSATDGPWRIRKFKEDRFWMNLPGAIAPLAALAAVRKDLLSTSGEVVDYSAQNRLGLWLRWRELTASAEDVPQVFKLMWTDLAASAMTGSKGVLGAGNAERDSAANIQILPVVHRVKYHLLFGIPAFILALVLLLIGAVVLFALIFGKSSLKVVDHRLKQTSVGRVVTTLRHPEASDFTMSSRQWTEENAERPLDMSWTTAVPGRHSAGWSPVPVGSPSPEGDHAIKRKPVMAEAATVSSEGSQNGWHQQATYPR